MTKTKQTMEEKLREQIELFQRRNLEEKAALLNALKQRFGSDVINVVARVVAEQTRQEWAEIARKEERNSIDELIQLAWEPLHAVGYEFTIDHRHDGVQVHCTVCPIYNMTRELGIVEWGYHFHCSKDPQVVEGFNPNIGFRRTKTLMEGYDCCDHFYYIKD
jgi:predicted ArsR family transcriptional regulator